MYPLEDRFQLSTWGGARCQESNSTGVVRNWRQGLLTILQRKLGNEQVVALTGERRAKIEFSCV